MPHSPSLKSRMYILEWVAAVDLSKCKPRLAYSECAAYHHFRCSGCNRSQLYIMQFVSQVLCPHAASAGLSSLFAVRKQNIVMVLCSAASGFCKSVARLSLQLQIDSANILRLALPACHHQQWPILSIQLVCGCTASSVFPVMAQPRPAFSLNPVQSRGACCSQPEWILAGLFDLASCLQTSNKLANGVSASKVCPAEGSRDCCPGFPQSWSLSCSVAMHCHGHVRRGPVGMSSVVSCSAR